MKRIILFTLLVAATMFTACEKYNPTDTASSGKELDNGIIYGEGANEAGLPPVIEWGDTISTTENAARVSSWATEFPNTHTDTKLSTGNYGEIRDVDGAKGVAFIPTDSIGWIAMAYSADKELIYDVIYKLDDGGGTEIDTADFRVIMDKFDNEDGYFPGSNTIGLNLLNDINNQSGTYGFFIANALDEVGEDDRFGITVRSYDSHGDRFGITGTDGGKNCRVWVPGHYETVCCGPGPTELWINGYWRECVNWEVFIWVFSNN